MTSEAQRYVADVAAARKRSSEATERVTALTSKYPSYEVDLGETQFQASLSEDGTLNMYQGSQDINISMQDMPAFIEWLRDMFSDGVAE